MPSNSMYSVSLIQAQTGKNTNSTGRTPPTTPKRWKTVEAAGTVLFKTGVYNYN